MQYAKNTTVAPDRSRMEIERTLTRYGATGFMYGWTETGAVVGFMLNEIQYRVKTEKLHRKDFEKGPGGRRRNNAQVKTALEQAEKQQWRALGLIIKAKLEWLEDKTHKVEEEFLPWMVMPDGRTFAEWAMPQLEDMQKQHKMPRLMIGLSSEVIDGDVEE